MVHLRKNHTTTLYNMNSYHIIKDGTKAHLVKLPVFLSSTTIGNGI